MHKTYERSGLVLEWGDERTLCHCDAESPATFCGGSRKGSGKVKESSRKVKENQWKGQGKVKEMQWKGQGKAVESCEKVKERQWKDSGKVKERQWKDSGKVKERLERSMKGQGKAEEEHLVEERSHVQPDGRHPHRLRRHPAEGGRGHHPPQERAAVLQVICDPTTIRGDWGQSVEDSPYLLRGP